MTGPIATRMKPATEAMTAYFAAVNDAGGINGRHIKLIVAGQLRRADAA